MKMRKKRTEDRAMIYLKLFLNFLKIGTVSFGGGYGMIALIQETVITNGWMTETEFLNFLAVAESTPGPIAVNMATYIGSVVGGILGSFLATLGVVLPAFLIILTISAFIKNLMKFAGVKAVIGGIRPAIVGLIISTAIVMILSTVFGVENAYEVKPFDYRGIVIFAIIAAIAVAYKLIRKNNFSPILLILISAGLGMIFYGALG